VNAQDRTKAMNEKSITWFGIDFTLAKFTNVSEDPELIVNQYLNAINSLVEMEPEKYDLKKWFKKNDVTIDLEQVKQRNEKIDPGSLVISDAHEIAQDDVKKLVNQYNTQGKSGMGLLFVAENLNKVSQTGSYYVVFFDLGTKEIIDSRKMTAKASGFGFRNYWAGSVYNVMKVWLKS
jgi:hypothetical protein